MGQMGPSYDSMREGSGAGHKSPPTNTLGLAGFIVSLVGMVVTLGFLCPVGFLLSVIALFKAPRGFAIAGTVIGVIGSGLAVMVVFLAIYTVSAAKSGYASAMVHFDLESATYPIEEHFADTSTLPDNADGNALLTSYYDSWGQAITYQKDSETVYTLTSSGPDMIAGNADDVAMPYTAGHMHSYSSHSPFGHIEESPSDDPAFIRAKDALGEKFAGQPAPPIAEGQAVVEYFLDRQNNPLRYRPLFEATYILESAGKDGQWDTEDDVVVNGNIPESEQP